MKKRIFQVKIMGTLLILFVLITTAGVFSYSNASNTRNSEYKYITKLEVRYGDTLWGIAEQYITDEYNSIEDYIEEIKVVNRLKSNKIYTNQSLLIPYYEKVD